MQYCCCNGEQFDSQKRYVVTFSAVRSVVMYVSSSYEGKQQMEGTYGSVTWLRVFLQTASLPATYLVLPVKYVSVNVMYLSSSTPLSLVLRINGVFSRK